MSQDTPTPVKTPAEALTDLKATVDAANKALFSAGQPTIKYDVDYLAAQLGFKDGAEAQGCFAVVLRFQRRTYPEVASRLGVTKGQAMRLVIAEIDRRLGAGAALIFARE